MKRSENGITGDVNSLPLIPKKKLLNCKETLFPEHTSMRKARTAPNMTLPHMCRASTEFVNLKPYSLAAIAVPARRKKALTLPTLLA